jgi:hypothetical protein
LAAESGGCQLAQDRKLGQNFGTEQQVAQDFALLNRIILGAMKSLKAILALA